MGPSLRVIIRSGSYRNDEETAKKWFPNYLQNLMYIFHQNMLNFKALTFWQVNDSSLYFPTQIKDRDTCFIMNYLKEV